MFRIDTSRAVAVRPDADAAGTPGYFGAGDPTTGFLPTQFSPDWCNDLQENIMEVLADGGITGVKGPDGDVNLRDAIRAMVAGKTRLRLSGNLDLYVATTGNDANPGTVGAPFRNIQSAINYVYGRLDLNGYPVAIHIGAGTYTEVVNIRYPPVGAAPLGTPITLLGDTTTPSNVVVTTSDASAYKISGSTQVHARAYLGGGITATNSTITLTGTPAFSVGFAAPAQGGGIWYNGCLFSGSATGKRYLADAFGWIITAGGGANFLPGNVAGTLDALGKYS